MKLALQRRDYIGWAIIGAFFFSFLGYLIFDVSLEKKKESLVQEATEDILAPETTVRKEVRVPEVHGSDPATLETIQKVAKHMLLPDGDVVVAEVIDPDGSRQKNPVFYRYAKKGDKVLIYPDRAILYNPASDKIVDIVHIPAQ